MKTMRAYLKKLISKKCKCPALLNDWRESKVIKKVESNVVRAYLVTALNSQLQKVSFENQSFS